MAKIPGIRYTTKVASLGRDDIYRPMRVANAMSKAFLMTNAAAKNLADLYERHVNELETDRAHTKTNEQLNGWEQGQAKIQEYDLTEMNMPAFDNFTEDVGISLTETVVDATGAAIEVIRKKIPKYEIYPQLRDKFYKGVIEANAQSIRHGGARRRWQNDMLRRHESEQAKVVVRAMEDMEHHRIALKINNIKMSTAVGRYDQAETLAIESGLPDSVTGPLRFENSKAREDGWYETQLELAALAVAEPKRTAEAIAGLKTGLKRLGDEKYDGLFNPNEQTAMANRLSSALHRLTSATEIKSTVNIKLLRNDLKKTIAARQRGDRLDPDLPNQLRERAKGLGAEEDLILELQELDYTEKLFPILDKARSTIGLADSYRLVTNLGLTEFGNPMVAHVINKVKTQIAKRMDEIKRDPTGVSVRDGVIPNVPFDFEKISESVAATLHNGELAYERTGVASPGLSQQDAVQLRDKIDNAPLNSKIAMIGEIVEGGRDRSSLIFDKLADVGLEGSYLVAGTAMAQGDTLSAELLIKANGYRKTKPAQQKLKEAIPELQQYWKAETGGAYEHDSKLVNPMYNAFLDAYSYLNRNGEGYEEDIAGQAHDVVTGMLMDYGDQMLIPPYRNYNQTNDFEEYLDDLHPDNLLKMGDPLTVDKSSPANLLKAIRDERTTLIYAGLGNDGTANYNIQYNGRLVFDKNNGQLFNFKVLKDPLTLSEVSTDKRAKHLASRVDDVASRKEVQRRAYKGLDLIEDIKRVMLHTE